MWWIRFSPATNPATGPTILIGLLALITKPIRIYLSQVLDPAGKTWLDPVVRPVERLAYQLMGVDPGREQDWKSYTTALLVFSAVGVLFTYAILRLQHLLPLNPQGLPALSPALAFNTAVSFTTNTNWQSYGGEATMSYFSQMVALTIHNFTSAAVGISIAAALVRGIARQAASTLGNFWVDVTRTTLYLLLGTVILIGALHFLPALTLGPIVEHFLTLNGRLF